MHSDPVKWSIYSIELFFIFSLSFFFTVLTRRSQLLGTSSRRSEFSRKLLSSARRTKYLAWNRENKGTSGRKLPCGTSDRKDTVSTGGRTPVTLPHLIYEIYNLMNI